MSGSSRRWSYAPDALPELRGAADQQSTETDADHAPDVGGAGEGGERAESDCSDREPRAGSMSARDFVAGRCRTDDDQRSNRRPEPVGDPTVRIGLMKRGLEDVNGDPTDPNATPSSPRRREERPLGPGPRTTAIVRSGGRSSNWLSACRVVCSNSSAASRGSSSWPGSSAASFVASSYAGVGFKGLKVSNRSLRCRADTGSSGIAFLLIAPSRTVQRGDTDDRDRRASQ